MDAEQSPVSTSAANLGQSDTNYPFTFQGNAREYFGIWIVNLILTILTLGIYSAWAKVRNNQYLYGNTEFAGDRFEYLASPITILKGRLIAMAFLAVYLFGDVLFPGVSLIIILIIMVLFPVIMVRSLRFNAVNSAWRGIRFNFAGTTGQAYGVFLKGFFLTMITMGIAYPIMHFWIAQFRMGKHKFGQSAFNMLADAGDFFKIYLKAWGLYILAIIVMVGLMFGMGSFAAFQELSNIDEGDWQESYEEQVNTETDAEGIVIYEEREYSYSAEYDSTAEDEVLSEEEKERRAEAGKKMLQMIGLIYFFVFIVFGMIWLYVWTRTTNLLWSHTELESKDGKHFQFTSNMPLWGLIKLQITNTLAIIVSLGMLIPWAVIRTLRFRLDHLVVSGDSDLDQFIADETAEQRALGEELGDAFDLGIGI